MSLCNDPQECFGKDQYSIQTGYNKKIKYGIIFQNPKKGVFMYKQLSALILGLCAVTSAINAGVSYSLEDFSKPKAAAGFSYLNLKKDGNTDTLAKVSLSPDFKFKGIDLGLDLNIYVPFDKASNHDLNWVSLRHIGYDYKRRHGFKWGRLKNVTLGYGLLMDSYDSGAAGNTEFTIKKAGFLGYTSYKKVKVTGMFTSTQTQAGRIAYQLLDSTPVFGSPLIVGATVVNDVDGVNTTIGNNTITRPAQLGYAVDAGIPIAGEFLTLYGEYAELQNTGPEDNTRGASTGLKGNIFNIVNYRAEYRIVGTNFVPGYFGQRYEATPFDLGTYKSEKLSGFLVSSSTSLLNGYVKAGAMYEKYDDKNLLTASVGWRQIGPTVGVINYIQPFQGRYNATLIADLLYTTTFPWKTRVQIRRDYFAKDQFTEQVSFGVQADISTVFAFL